MHLRSLERFDFDSVLLPYNFTVLSDDGYRADVRRAPQSCAAARGGGADDQVDRAPALAGRSGAAVQLV